MKTGLHECEDCGWRCTLDGQVLNPECDSCGGELVPVEDSDQKASEAEWYADWLAQQ